MNQTKDIVVVDDNSTILDVLSEIFVAYGYTVRTASNGFAALAVLRDRVPAFLLADLYMPGMSGFELLSVVRRRFPTIAVIAMSGAYPGGGGVPSGVAADGFYAKGSTSTAELFNILNAIEDEDLRQSTREETPIWVPALPLHHGERSTMAVACPECLRPFSHFLHEEPIYTRNSNCPHCSRPVQLAMVRPSEEIDKTTIPISMINTSANESALTSYAGANHPLEYSLR